MIHSVGDSHAQWSFKGTGVTEHEIGPVTMNSVGVHSSSMLDSIMKGLGIIPSDIVILCFGEIDVRCHVQPRIDVGEEEYTVISTLVDRYVKNILESKFENLWVLSITPPWDYASWKTFIINESGRSVEKDPYPLRGSDENRVRFTKNMNKFLRDKCKSHKIPFVDVYDFYSDERGMLNPSLSDGTLHIGDTKFVKQVLDNMGI